MTRHENHPLPSYNSEISRLFFAMSIIIPMTLILALLLFKEPFHLLQNAFSELGETMTSEGRPNGLSRWIFSSGWIACGLTMGKIGLRYTQNSGLRNALFKRWIAWAGCVGFFVAVTPNDIQHVLHSIGMGLVVGVTFLFGLVFLLELRSSISSFAFYGNMAVLVSSVLTYAVTFAIDSAGKQAAQKLCTVGLLLVVEKASTLAPEGFEWREALQAIRK